MPCFRVYGLRVRVDVDVPGLHPCGCAGGPHDVAVYFDAAAATSRYLEGEWHLHPRLRDKRFADRPVPAVRIEADATGAVSLQYLDDTRFLVSADGSEVHCLRPEGMSVASASTYLVNGVLALVLRLRGTTSLHAAGVATPAGALVFPGHSGAGKSTLTWALDRAGLRVLTDDVTVLEPGPAVSPGYPRVRLWPWTVEGLLGDVEALPLVSDDWDKRWAVVEDFDPEPVPLAAICVLDGHADAVELERLQPTAALLALMANVYLDYMLDHAARAHDFEVLGSLVDQVPVFRVRRPRDLDRAVPVATEVVARVLAALPPSSPTLLESRAS